MNNLRNSARTFGNKVRVTLTLLATVFAGDACAVGGGNAPQQRLGEATDYTLIILLGTLFFAAILLAGIRRVSPALFNKLTLGAFAENTEDFTLAKQLAETKHDLEMLRTIVLGMSSPPATIPTEDLRFSVQELTKEKDEVASWIDLEGGLDQLISRKILDEGKNSSLDELFKLRNKIGIQESERDERAALNRMIEYLMDNAMRLRTRVFTIFAGVNLWLIFFVIMGGVYRGFLPETSAQALKVVFSENIPQGIAGLYLSMVVFLVYVFRNANSRISVLLAIKEDQNHQHTAFNYLSRLRSGASPSERDIEAIKLILQNHAERERGNEHPYELVLRGITNSTVLVKGGKVISSKQKD